VETEANYSTFKAYCDARQLKRIEGLLKRAEFWEKLNQGEEPVTRKTVSEGIRKEKATGPVTMYGKPYDLGKIGRGSWEREKKQGKRSQFINSYPSLAGDRE
jgi:hypothetical protein